MPGFDGTGPRGLGPMTGAAGGYCLLKVPEGPGEPVTGFTGRRAEPVTMSSLHAGGITLDDLKMKIAHVENALRYIHNRIRKLEEGPGVQLSGSRK